LDRLPSKKGSSSAAQDLSAHPFQTQDMDASPRFSDKEEEEHECTDDSKLMTFDMSHAPPWLRLLTKPNRKLTSSLRVNGCSMPPLVVKHIPALEQTLRASAITSIM
jgi:hypothetical protein